MTGFLFYLSLVLSKATFFINFSLHKAFDTFEDAAFAVLSKVI
jgi:hypothetical protein